MKPRKPPVYTLDDDTNSLPIKDNTKKEEDYFANDIKPKPKKEVKEEKQERKVISMGPERKLTKAAEAKLAIWKGNSRGKAKDAFFKSIVEHARTKLGHSAVLLGSQANALIVCIPMYAGHGDNAGKYPGCLPMEFVLAQDGFPLGLVSQVVGKPGVGKSALVAEFGRWFDIAGGGLNLVGVESKIDDVWYESIMTKKVFANTPVYIAQSVEGWQRCLSTAMETTRTDMLGTKTNPGPGPTFPVLYAVDSIMGKQSEETQEQIIGTRNVKSSGGGKKKRTNKVGLGHASRGFPIEAQVITRYTRTVPTLMDNWPFALVLVNQLRINTDQMGNPERNKGGGVQVDFQTSFELEIRKVGGHKKMIRTESFTGFTINISCEKNSFGPTHRQVQTRFIWWYKKDKETDEWQQETVVDWDWSTVHLLDNILNGDNVDPQLKKCLREVGFHLEVTSRGDSDNAAWSENVGMKKSDACSWSSLGALIREDKKLMNVLREALFINKRPLLQGDYLSQLEDLSEELP